MDEEHLSRLKALFASLETDGRAILHEYKKYMLPVHYIKYKQLLDIARAFRVRHKFTITGGLFGSWLCPDCAHENYETNVKCSTCNWSPASPK